MCFIKRIGKNIPKPQIAERDIVVYKYTKSYGSSFCCDNTKFLSLIYNFKYITNKKSKKIPLTPRLSTLFEIYPWLRNSSNYHTNDCPVISINKGYHSYMSLNRVKEDILDDSPIYTPGVKQVYEFDIFNYYIGEFVIPKGSEYYKNHMGEIVSSCLMYTGKFEIFNPLI